MTYKNKILSAFCCLILSSCSSKPVDEYVDYFYSNKVSEAENNFTYILYLGEEGKSIYQHQKDHRSISAKNKTNAQLARTKRSSNISKEDAQIPLSFRMEEEAFKRLALLLKKKQLCSNKPEYTQNEYTWLRYTIKGKCS